MLNPRTLFVSMSWDQDSSKWAWSMHLMLGMFLFNVIEDLLLIFPSFLLSPLSPFLDTSPASYERGIMMTHNTRDEESTIFVEIAEYARSLVPVTKGHEQVTMGLPQLLPYKLARAWRLAELGEVDLAKR